MLFFWLLLPMTCTAWGREGHTITGRVAQHFISEKTLDYLKYTLFPPYNDGDLGRIATWADEIKGRRGYNRKISSLHYVDPKDSPPTECSYIPLRDCPTGWCLPQALRNVTLSLQGNIGSYLFSKNDKLLPEWTFSEPDTPRKLGGLEETVAIQLLVHFMGDIHQPLHICGIARGGNDISLRFDGHSTNMHALWDHGLLSKRILEFESLDSYISFLINLDIDVPDLSPDEIAKETNLLNCDIVWKNTVRHGRRIELPLDYYKNSVSFLDIQLKRAGVRMASILDRSLIA